MPSVSAPPSVTVQIACGPAAQRVTTTPRVILLLVMHPLRLRICVAPLRSNEKRCSLPAFALHGASPTNDPASIQLRHSPSAPCQRSQPRTGDHIRGRAATARHDWPGRSLGQAPP